uniref:Saposin B-type domain-containing protein n=1 Tax=Panagrolaimus davidi TaxID=227884 RepID=A0A914R3G3_9BILA
MSMKLLEILISLKLYHADVCTKCQKPLEGINDGISCTRNPCEDVGEQIQDLVINSHINVHKLCAECVVNAAAFVLARNEYIIGNGIGLECVDQTCRRLFLISQMHQFLPPELEEQLQDKVIQKSMEAFCHENPNHHIFK